MKPNVDILYTAYAKYFHVTYMFWQEGNFVEAIAFMKTQSVFTQINATLQQKKQETLIRLPSTEQFV